MQSPAALPPPSVRTVVLSGRRSSPVAAPSTFSYVTFRADGAVVDDTGRHRRVTVVRARATPPWLRALRWAGVVAAAAGALALLAAHPDAARGVLEGTVDFARRVAELMG